MTVNTILTIQKGDLIVFTSEDQIWKCKISTTNASSKEPVSPKNDSKCNKPGELLSGIVTFYKNCILLHS